MKLRRIICSMTAIDWNLTSTWLKTTVGGIITLGAIGSIVAFAALKVVGAIGKRLFRVAFDRFMFSNVRPFSFAALLCYRYAAEGRWADLVIYTIGLFASFSADLVLFGVCLLATVVVAIQLGIASPGLLVTLVIFTGLTFILLLRDLMSIAGIWAARFHQEHTELRKLLKDKTTFFQLTDQIFENLKSPPQPPPSPSSPEQAQGTVAPPSVRPPSSGGAT